jgi:hypothetical protein
VHSPCHGPIRCLDCDTHLSFGEQVGIEAELQDGTSQTPAASIKPPSADLARD